MPALGRPRRIAICARCRHDVLPRLAQPSWHREKHRASAAERETPVSPEAQKIRERKERRAALRKQVKVGGMLAAAKFYLSLKSHEQPEGRAIMQEDCPDCLQLQHDAT